MFFTLGTIKEYRKTIFYFLLVILPTIFLILFTNKMYNTIFTIKSNIDDNVDIIEELKNGSINMIISNYLSKAELQNEFTSEYLLFSLATYNKNVLERFIKNFDEESIKFNNLSTESNHDNKYTILFESNQKDRTLFIANKVGMRIIDDKYALSTNEFRFTTLPIIVLRRESNLDSPNTINMLKRNFSIMNFKFVFDNQSNAFGDNHITFNSLEDLKDYNILIPTYVSTNNGRTYDFLIVREIQLFKLIRPYTYDINHYNDIISDYKAATSRLLYMVILFTGVIDIFLFLSILLAAIKANSSFNAVTASRKDKV